MHTCNTYFQCYHPIHFCVPNTNSNKQTVFCRIKGEQLSSCTGFTCLQNWVLLPPLTAGSSAQTFWENVNCVLRAPSSGKVAVLH